MFGSKWMYLSAETFEKLAHIIQLFECTVVPILTNANM